MISAWVIHSSGVVEFLGGGVESGEAGMIGSSSSGAIVAGAGVVPDAGAAEGLTDKSLG